MDPIFPVVSPSPSTFIQINAPEIEGGNRGAGSARYYVSTDKSAETKGALGTDE